jgi:hypothetical protein
MMKKEVVIAGINLMDTIRRSIVIKYGEETIDVLAHKHYAKAYLGIFCFTFVGMLTAVIAFLVRELQTSLLSPGTVAATALCFIVQVWCRIFYSAKHV